MRSYYSKDWELREAHEKSLNEIEELKRFQGSTFGTIARRRLVEDQDTILELTGKIQELQNEISCMNGSRDFQDAVVGKREVTCQVPSITLFTLSCQACLERYHLPSFLDACVFVCNSFCTARRVTALQL